MYITIFCVLNKAQFTRKKSKIRFIPTFTVAKFFKTETGENKDFFAYKSA